MNINKSFTKKDLCEIISLYEMDIEDYLIMNKAKIQSEITSYLKYNNISFIKEYPEIHNSEELTDFLSKEKPNSQLNYKKRQEVIQTAKKILNYTKLGYSIALTDYTSLDEIYEDGLMISNHCDIPTCRRAIEQLNLDNKIRNKLNTKMSSKVIQEIQIKNKNKLELMPSLMIKRGHFLVTFD